MISLKGFHLFFIAASIVVTAWFAIYNIQMGFHGTSAVFTIVFLLISFGLMVYGMRVFKKFKSL